MNYNKIDQFEDFFTLTDTVQTSSFFQKLLTVIEHNPGFTIIITLREDFLSKLEESVLGRLFNERSLQRVFQMEKEQLKEAIASPLLSLPIKLESGLMECLINDINGQWGYLPLLQFTLTKLWEQQQNYCLSLSVYQESGGITGSITNHINQFYIHQLDENQRQKVKFILLKLIDLQPNQSPTRLIANLKEFDHEEQYLINILANARLIVTGYDQNKQIETVEIIHETLINNWRELNLLVEEYQDFLLWKNNFDSTILIWKNTGYDQGALLKGVLLENALNLSQQYEQLLTDDQKKFIAESYELKLT